MLDYNVANNQYYHYMAWLEFVNDKDETEYYCYEDRDDNTGGAIVYKNLKNNENKK